MRDRERREKGEMVGGKKQRVERCKNWEGTTNDMEWEGLGAAA
jgi:hypothetical protein